MEDRELFIRTLPNIMIIVAILLTFGFLVTIISALTGIELGNTLSHPNPFTAYEAIWPGQPTAELSEYIQRTDAGFVNCFSGDRYSTGSFGSWGIERYLCMDNPSDSVFGSVQVAIADSRIHNLLLFSNVLLENALMLYWGIPDSIAQSRKSQWVELYWERRGYSASALVNKTNSVVKLITVTAKE
jgi:hypothetical protein